MSRLFPIPDALDSDAWYTPPWIFDALGETFDLDVAHPSDPLPWIPARHRYTVADDGLTSPWFGFVWCNPPYSGPLAWCRKWADHTEGGLLLTREDSSTRAYRTAIGAASSLHIFPRRVQFLSGNGQPTGKATFSTVLLGRGDRADRAILRLANLTGGTALRLERLTHAE